MLTEQAYSTLLSVHMHIKMTRFQFLYLKYITFNLYMKLLVCCNWKLEIFKALMYKKLFADDFFFSFSLSSL